MVINYCPSCGAQFQAEKWPRYNAGAAVLCPVCGRRSERPALAATRVKLELARILIAAVWLTRCHGDFTRAELAAHLAVSNSPRLRDLLATLAADGRLECRIGAHPQNGRPTYFFSRPAILAAPRPTTARPRAYATPGAAR